MGFFRGVKKVTKPLVNAPRWMDVEGIKSHSGMIMKVAKSIFIPKKAKITESFEEAMTRLHLTEENIKARQTEFKKLLLIYAVISFALFGYAIYHFWHGHIIAGFLAVIVTSISLVQVFRYHFWLFQIKQRKLGCTLREWYRCGLLGKSL